VTIAAGELVMVDAYGDHRRPAAYHLYVVMGEFDRQYRVRPVNRGGQHTKDKVVRATELHRLAEFGVRIKRLDRSLRLMWLERHGPASRSWITPGYPDHPTAYYTQVDREALPLITWQGPQEADRE